MKLILLLLITNFGLIISLSTHWTKTLPKICSNNAPQEIRTQMLRCDKLMDQESKSVLNDCIKRIHNLDLDEYKDQPRICFYQKNGRQVDNCKTQMYKEMNYNLTQIIQKEHKHMWCYMKAARPLGWEQLCVGNLPRQKKSLIQRCDERFKDISEPINYCYSQIINKPMDGRPAACRSFEHPYELWKCLEGKSAGRSLVDNKNASNNQRNLRQLEEKANGYMNCLKRIDQRRP